MYLYLGVEYRGVSQVNAVILELKLTVCHNVIGASIILVCTSEKEKEPFPKEEIF